MSRQPSAAQEADEATPIGKKRMTSFRAAPGCPEFSTACVSGIARECAAHALAERAHSRSRCALSAEEIVRRDDGQIRPSSAR